MLHEGRVGLIRAHVVFAKDTVARCWQVAVALLAVLMLVVDTSAEIRFLAEAEEPIRSAQTRFDADVVILAQTTFVATRSVEIENASAVGVTGSGCRIVKAIGTLTGVARLPPPMTLEVRTVKSGCQRQSRIEDNCMAGRSPEAVAVEEVIAKDVAAPVCTILVFTQTRVCDIRVFTVVVELGGQRLPIAERGHRLKVKVIES